MRILIQVNHPAHVHFFKHFIWDAEERGHVVKVVTSGVDMALDLLDNYDIDYELFSSRPERDVLRIRTQLRRTRDTYRVAKEFDPDVLTSIGGTAVSHVSKVVRGQSLAFYDTEHATLQNTVTYPFSDRICTPDCYRDDIGEKQVRYPGYHELAYLHPDRFTPDPEVLDQAGLDEDDQFVILRQILWGSAHDVGDSGFDDIVEVVEELERTGTEVRITSQTPLPEEIEHCRIQIPPHRIHHLMYYADAYVGESATMASESAVLGTPTVFISSSRRGYTDELDEEYGLVFNFHGEDRQERGLDRAVDILNDYDPEVWKRRRERMLEDKIDTTDFIFEMVEDMGQ